MQSVTDLSIKERPKAPIPDDNPLGHRFHHSYSHASRPVRINRVHVDTGLLSNVIRTEVDISPAVWTRASVVDDEFQARGFQYWHKLYVVSRGVVFRDPRISHLR